MTDKEQIIIDGVDVSECNFRLERDNQQKCECTHATGFGVICDCHSWQNCYYKQLSRKTQIVEQQHKTIDELIGCVSLWEEFTEEESKLAKDSSIADLIMLLRERTQDYKNYKKQVEDFYKHMDRVRSWITQAAKDLGLDTEHSFGPQHFTFAVRCLKEEKEKFKQECEELKKQLEFVRTHRTVIDAEKNRYRKALEEIETVTKINCEEICGRKFADCKDTSCFSANILDIINKAKGGEDE